MKKALLLMLSMVFCVAINAKVSLDFTNAASEWGFPSSTSAGAAIVGTETSFTNGTYTVYLYGASGNGCYANSGYIMICNSGSYIKLQGFDFAVGTIVVGGHSGGSASATMNIYVGETAVSTECKDCTADHTFEIAADYQTANTQYICMNTSSKNYQVTTIDVYAVGEEIGDDTPTGHGYEADDPYTCEEAIEIISALASGGTVKDIYVKGIVSTIGSFTSGYGELTYYISDDGTTTNQLYIYDGYYLNNEKFTSDYANELMVGDEVIVYGTFTNYKGNTPEGSMGATYIYSLTRNGETPGTGGDTPTGHGYEPDDPYTASEALEIAKELDSSTTISGVYVKGIISQIDEISTSYGNATYYISDDGTTNDELEIYRGYYLDGAHFTSEDQIKVSDTVVVYGDLVDFYGNTPELTTGSKIYSINGSTEAPDTGDTGGDEGGISGTVTHGSSMITLTNPDVSVGTETATFDVTSITGLDNGTSVDGTEFELSDGSTFVCAKGNGSSAPAYYTTSGNIELRIYYNNTITFTCSQKIAKIEMSTETTAYEGSDVETVVFSEDGTTAEFCNVRDGSNNTQLRVQNITIYYAAESEEEPEPEPEPDDGHTFNFEENTYGMTVYSGSDGDYETEVTQIVSDDGVVLNFDSGHYRMWNSSGEGNHIRIGGSASSSNDAYCTISGPAGSKVLEVVFTSTGSSDNMSASNPTADPGSLSYSNHVSTWTGEAESVTFHFTAVTHIYYIDVTLDTPAGAFTITDVGYATYYTDEEYTMPEGVKGSTVTSIKENYADDGGEYLEMSWEYEAGSTVPAQTALVLQGEAGTYTYTVTSTGAETPEDNLLQGSSTEVLTTGPNESSTGYYFYELTVGEYGVGFYWANEEGSAFTSEAHKAWLATGTAHPAKFIGFGEGGSTTGISAVESSPATDDIYTIQGVRVSDMSQKGIYIVGGKKVLVK